MRRFLFLVPLVLAACSKSEEKKPGQTPSTGYTAPGGGGTTSAARVPITQADVDFFVTVSVDAAKIGAPKAIEKTGKTMEQYADIFARVNEAYYTYLDVTKRGKPVPAGAQGDIDIVKANLERIEKAREGKEVK
jgi:hypothetical protein